ncbi:MAG TPA: hypothetical protein VFT00_01145 [Nocardioides sp.]|nr:hypothetical protein [Nocardioides sp.]
MADEDHEKDGPSLELPSLGFRRKRRAKDPAPEDEQAIAREETPVEETQAAAPPEPAPVVEDAPPARPLYADELERSDAEAPTEVVRPVPADEVTPVPGPAPLEHVAPTRRRRRAPSSIGGMAAAILTGLLVGVITVGLTWGSLRLCELVQGTSSCGNPGFLLLVAIMVAMTLLGSLLLRVWGVPDPGSTSFLAVGLLAVLTLLFLVDVLFNWWMIIVVPLFAVLTFALSHWVTTAFVEPTHD